MNAADPPLLQIAKPHIGDDEIAAAVSVLRSGKLTQGTEVAAFENDFARYVPGSHCVAVNSGTAALQLALLALGIGHGDEVIVPSFTFGATAHAVAMTGAQPIFVDIEPESFCINPTAVAGAITNRTAAVIAVHLFGHPAPLGYLAQLCSKYSLALIEDAAQALGARSVGRPIGTWGDAASFSFYPTKAIHTLEGGMVTTFDASTADRVRMLRNQGMADRPYHYLLVGTNARMTDLAAAIGRVQLQQLPVWLDRRRANAAYLTAHLRRVTTPTTPASTEHAFHLYTVRAPGTRDALVTTLARAGIEARICYPIGVHQTMAYRTGAHLPITDEATREVLSLPVHPHISDGDLARIVQAIEGAP